MAPIPEPHFPNRLFLFVWRNWELANTDRLAKVLNTSERSVLKLGAMLGLPEKQRLTHDQLRRIYTTVIRQNWHVLPQYTTTRNNTTATLYEYERKAFILQLRWDFDNESK